jgi:acyl-CoA thioester hydrolase
MYTTRIYYQDTDGGGVVYFANYLRFFEKSWFEYLMTIGISLPAWEESGTYIMVKSAHLDLQEKLRYGTTVNVITSITVVKNASFTLAHRVIREGRLMTTGETMMVCVDIRGKLKRLPDEFKDKLLKNLDSESGIQDPK